jgi:hypothetical protein
VNKVRVSSLLLAFILVCVSSKADNEFVESPTKKKKFYPSCQQYGELLWEVIDLTNRLSQRLIELQKGAIAEITPYLEGDKNCFLHQATKQQRASTYSQHQKNRDALQAMLDLCPFIAPQVK